MDLWARYEQLHNGVRFAIETVEDVYRLPQPVERELHDWVVSEWERRRRNIEWCDNKRDLLMVATGLTGLVESYKDLRKTLFSDLHHYGEEPPWRRVHGRCAVRLPFGFHTEDDGYYVLRNQGMNRWTFSVHGSTRSSRGEYEPTSTEFDVELAQKSCLIPDELKGHRFLGQLFYGLKLMTGEHYDMRTLQDQVELEAARIARTETDDDGWE